MDNSESRYPRIVEWRRPDPARPGCTLREVVTIPYGWKAPARQPGKFLQAARYFETATLTQKRPVVFPKQDQGLWQFGLFDRADQEIGWGMLDADENAHSFAVLSALFRQQGLQVRIQVAVELTTEEKAALDVAGRN
jgi:hypothetical protein